MSFYPICLDLEGKHCVVVGGGRVAERKALGLLSCSARVSVISPDLTEGLHRQNSAGSIKWIDRQYRPGDLADAFLVIAATDDEETQKEVYEEAVDKNLLLNVADVPRRCNFILPASVRRGDLTISVSTAGKSPALARKLRMELEEKFGQEYGKMVELLGSVRPEILGSGLPQPENEQLFKQLLHDDMEVWIKNKDWYKIEDHFRATLKDMIGDGWLSGFRNTLEEEQLN